MNKKETFGPQFLYADDLLQNGEWREATVEIADVLEPGTVQAANKQMVPHPVLKFKGTPKMLSLNSVNERLVRVQLGSKRSDGKWPGNKITLAAFVGDAFGEKDVPWIRVKVTNGRPIPFGCRKWMGKQLTNQKN